MELFSTEFFSALLAIILIDLVLAGDNAIVIALAARNLPPQEQHRAIVFGTIGAIVVRSLMTLGVVWLLKIPGLMLVGGLLLFWIAVKLIAPGNDGDEHGPAASTFWGAMKTIVIADAVMGVDNVLAVAGASHGSFLLVVLGLLISIPIVVWGSRFVLKLIERFPWVILLGGGVLGFTAGKMILNEPLVKEWTGGVSPVLYWSFVIASVAFVVVLGQWLKQRTQEAAMEGESNASRSGDDGRVLLAVNDSEQAVCAARHIAGLSLASAPREVHLVYVAPVLSRHAGKFLSPGMRRSFTEDRIARVFAKIRPLFAAANMQVIEHRLSGVSAGKRISRLAEELQCGRIVIGTRRESALLKLFTSSVSAGVIQHARVPVEVIALGQAPSWLRFGLPAGLTALLALLIAD